MSCIIDIHTHSHKSKNNIEIINANLTPSVNFKYYSVGLHPWHINSQKITFDITALKQILQKNTPTLMGEIGLDRTINTPIDIQRKVFIEQVNLAQKYNLSIILHCVRAWSDIIEIRKKQKVIQPWIFHGYNGNLQTAFQIIKHKCYLSFGKDLLSNPKIQAIFKETDLSFIFLETDDSDFDIEAIYKKAASLKEIDLNDLITVVYNNFKTLFNTV